MLDIPEPAIVGGTKSDKRDSRRSELSGRKRATVLGLTAVLCALSFAAVGLFPGVFYHIFAVDDYLLIHTIFEFMSIVVSFAVFTIGWYGYKQNGNKQALFIGVVFLVIGIIDFAHTLSYDGMPDFLSPNSVSKAATYWMAARLTDAVGLFAAAFILATSRNRFLRPSVLASTGLAFAAVTIVAVTYFPHLLPPMFVPGEGLTPLKVFLEWVAIAFYAGAIYVFGKRSGLRSDVMLLQAALVVGIFSELSFTLYASAYDTYNFMGHVYKVVAYALIFRALFVTSFEKPYAELVRARNRIEQSFARIGDALASGLELDETLQLIAELASDMLGSRHAAVMLLQDGVLRIHAERGMCKHPEKVQTEHSSAGKAIVDLKPSIVPDVNKFPGHSPDCHCQCLDGLPARSVVTAPIVSGGDIFGVVEVYSPAVNAFRVRDAELLSTFARQAAVAIRNSIAYERERTVAEILQRSLLPSAPTVPGLDIAVRYIPAEDIGRVGGDLYDVFQLDDDRLAILIGDVCGHGVEAASFMAMTAFTIKGFLIHGMSPGEALQHANRALCRRTSSDEQITFVTAFACILNIRTRTLEYANAGHHMPMIIKRGKCEVVDLIAGLPLVIDESAKYETHTLSLQDGLGIVLYTDGVVEARREGEFFGEEGLSQLCEETLTHSAADTLDTAITRVREWSGMLTDDVALLTVKWPED